MLPKHHIILGVIFSLILVFVFNISVTSALVVFLASVFIDIDHYLFYVQKKHNLNLKKAYSFYLHLPLNHKPIMHIFHTVEFMLLIFLLSYFNPVFLFVLIGMVFHSITDMIEFIVNKNTYCREFFLIRFLIKKDRSYYF